MYDYLIVGAGIFGSTFAHEMAKKGKKCLVVDKRKHIGGNAYCEKINNINVHKYGAHIFHTSNKAVWDYVNQFTEFNNFICSPIANYKGEIYNLPFNMNTFSKLWDIRRKLSVLEAQRLQGFPDDFKFPVSDAQAYHQLGNSVSVPIIKLIMKELIETYENNK